MAGRYNHISLYIFIYIGNPQDKIINESILGVSEKAHLFLKEKHILTKHLYYAINISKLLPRKL